MGKRKVEVSPEEEIAKLKSQTMPVKGLSEKDLKRLSHALQKEADKIELKDAKEGKENEKPDATTNAASPEPKHKGKKEKKSKTTGVDGKKEGDEKPAS